MGKVFDELIDSIVATTQDYKDGTVMDTDHVKAWIEQFEEDKQETILKEMDHILKKYYVSKKQAANFLETLLDKKEIVGDFSSNYNAIEFLDIQQKGNSQSDLLELMEEVMDEHFDIALTDCGTNPTTYIYLDDCMFSGNTVYRDIEKWASKRDIQNTTIHLVFLSLYKGNIKYVTNKLNSIFEGKNVEIEFWAIHWLVNNAWDNSHYDCLWPTQMQDDDEYVTSFSEYIEELREKSGKSNPFALFRPISYPNKEKLFTSKQGRIVVEQEFLKKGAYLFTFRKKDTIKPMGYSYFNDMGFGSMFITYRNIANNCPLVLWWGDRSQWYPLDQWHPLFPRTVN
ncbi:hypothetical protein CD798_12500 [Bacillaceae bacterium SAOS 7]|nr:hypothetical protein CD798_12500 [Bacillaceae bacterium SAOS 7]